MFGFSMGLASMLRGFNPFFGAGYEVMPPHGFLDSNNTLEWITPGLLGDPPLSASIDYLFEPAKGLGIAPKVGLAAAPFVPGFVGGLGYTFLRLRRRGGVV